MRMENSISPLRLYQFLNPLTASDLRRKYDVLPPRQLSRATLWLLRDHAHHLIRVWYTIVRIRSLTEGYCYGFSLNLALFTPLNIASYDPSICTTLTTWSPRF